MMIQLDQVSFSYEPGRPVLDDISLCLKREQPVALLGESGTGKTTLFRLLAGVLSPTEGRIVREPEKMRLAVQFQEDRLFGHLSVYENLKLVNSRLTREEAETCLTELNLEKELLSEPVQTLSGGMKRRLSLARALLYPSDFLLLDEPFAGLDAHTRQAARRAIRERRNGRGLFLVTHDGSDAEALDAQAFFLRDGRLAPSYKTGG